MSAKDTLRRNKTSIQSILCADYRLILNKVYERNLISNREYNNLKNINRENDEGHTVELLDKIMNKGEQVCRDFLQVLQTDREIETTYPELKNTLQVDASLPPNSVQERSLGRFLYTFFSMVTTTTTTFNHSCNVSFQKIYRLIDSNVYIITVLSDFPQMNHYQLSKGQGR